METRIVAFVFVLCFHTSLGYFSCYCNIGHAWYFIRSCPTQTSNIIGSMYKADHLPELPSAELMEPYCKPMLNIKVPDGYAAVPHYEKVGYILVDAGIERRVCIGNPRFHTAKLIHDPVCPVSLPNQGQGSSSAQTKTTVKPTTPSTHRTTRIQTTPTPKTTQAKTTHSMYTSKKTVAVSITTPTTYSPSTSRFSKWISVSAFPAFIWVTPPSQPVDCTGHKLEEKVRHRYTSSHPNSRLCPGSTTVTRDEGVLMEFCGAPEVYKWIVGIKVTDNCQAIPRYTPVSIVFQGSIPGGDESGIFLECTQFSIKIARQKCTTQVMEIVEVPPPVAAMYYTLTW